MYYDSKKDEYLKEKPNLGLNYLYNTTSGRLILKLITTKTVANIYAKYLNSGISKRKIDKFIKKNNIDMSEYLGKEYKSFNDFFMREIKPTARPIAKDLVAVADSKLTVYEIDDNSTFKIKGSIYTLKELLGEDKKYKYALIFRLCVDDYHHYIYPDDGITVNTKHIDGILHTVQPIALKKYRVFHENSREIAYLSCKHLKDICYIEVGAMMVGKIVNEPKKTFKKGEEKGHFEFGGSTIILLVNDATIDKKVIENSHKEIETVVKLGERIGSWR